jgi:hypothetical protein
MTQINTNFNSKLISGGVRLEVGQLEFWNERRILRKCQIKSTGIPPSKCKHWDIGLHPSSALPTLMKNIGHKFD